MYEWMRRERTNRRHLIAFLRADNVGGGKRLPSSLIDRTPHATHAKTHPDMLRSERSTREPSSSSPSMADDGEGVHAAAAVLPPWRWWRPLSWHRACPGGGLRHLLLLPLLRIATMWFVVRA